MYDPYSKEPSYKATPVRFEKEHEKMAGKTDDEMGEEAGVCIG
ncbi:MAG: hypothetical protein ACLTBV_24700 [Enterocloster bolteae]